MNNEISLDTMVWTKIEQQEKYLMRGETHKTSGTLYKDHLIILKEDDRSDGSSLCCLNLSIYFRSFCSS